MIYHRYACFEMDNFGVGHRIAHSALCFSPLLGVNWFQLLFPVHLQDWLVFIFFSSSLLPILCSLPHFFHSTISISAKGDLFLPLPFASAFATSLSLFLLSLYLFSSYISHFFIHFLSVSDSFLIPLCICIFIGIFTSPFLPHIFFFTYSLL